MTQPRSNWPKNLLTISENQARFDRPMLGTGLWRLGFRPFYLGAAAMSILGVLAWVGVIFNLFSLPAGHHNMPTMYWHAHEMVFGFAFAVIAGFLLTAANNWTGHVPAAGRPLMLLFCTWLAGRILFLMAWYPAAALLDLLFALSLIGLILRVLCLARLWRNLPILGLVVLMGSLNALFYASLLDLYDGTLLAPIEGALLMMLQLLVVMGGRVIPMFSQNGVPGLKPWRPTILDKITPAMTFLAIVSWLVLPATLAFTACLVAGLTNLIRWLGWKPWRTLLHPMVWILQLGYAWIPVTLILLGCVRMDWVPHTLAIHALGTGALGMIVIGMITRTAMGHTGRMIKDSRIERLCFMLIGFSAVLRVAAALPLSMDSLLIDSLISLAALTWSTAFGLYIFRYAPWLLRPRIDGKPG